MATTLNGYSLYYIQKMRSLTQSKPTFMGTPDAGVNYVYIADYDGAMRTFNIEGVASDTAATLDAWIQNMEGLHTGRQYQGSGYSFVLVYPGGTTVTVPVFVESFEWEYVAGETIQVRYWLTIHQRINQGI